MFEVTGIVEQDEGRALWRHSDDVAAEVVAVARRAMPAEGGGGSPRRVLRWGYCSTFWLRISFLGSVTEGLPSMVEIPFVFYTISRYAKNFTFPAVLFPPVIFQKQLKLNSKTSLLKDHVDQGFSPDQKFLPKNLTATRKLPELRFIVAGVVSRVIIFFFRCF